MASAPTSDLIPIINAVLDRARQEMGLGTDQALSKALNVSDQAIYLWRKGKLAPSANVLIPLILRQYKIQPVRSVVRYRRRRKTAL